MNCGDLKMPYFLKQRSCITYFYLLLIRGEFIIFNWNYWLLWSHVHSCYSCIIQIFIVFHFAILIMFVFFRFSDSFVHIFIVSACSRQWFGLNEKKSSITIHGSIHAPLPTRSPLKKARLAKDLWFFNVILVIHQLKNHFLFDLHFFLKKRSFITSIMM